MTLPSHQEVRASVTFDLNPLLFGALVKDSKLHESKDTKLPGCIECGEYRYLCNIFMYIYIGICLKMLNDTFDVILVKIE